ncbi:MAG: hypothetical protein KC766_41700 [Myxococcales bacterium]|nr:hypothetical protein [Myxococcales bacterium]
MNSDETSAPKPEQALSAGPNPYAPPAREPDESSHSPSADARPFTTTAVGVATFFGSALAGTIVMYLSLSRLGHAAGARRALLLGGGLTLLTLAAALSLPQGIGNAVPLGATIAMVMLGRQMLDPVVTPHLGRGGRKGSGWLVAGISLGSALVLLGVLVGLSEGLGVTGDDYVEASPGHRVVYESGASEGEARQVAETLERQEVFPPGDKAEVILRRRGAGLELQVVLSSGWKDQPVVDYYTKLADQLAVRTGRSPFAILLCNEFLITKKRISSTGP